MFRRLTAVAAAIPLLAGVSACSGDDDAASTTTIAPPVTNPPLPTSASTVPSTTIPETTSHTTTEQVPDSTTTMPTTAPTTTPDTAPPTTADGEPDWTQIVTALSLVFEELQGDPFAHEVDDFCLAGVNDCQVAQGAAVRQFRDEGWRALEYPTTPILDARLNGTLDDKPVLEAGFVVILVEQGPADFSRARVVDRTGNIVFEINADGDPGRANWLLARNEADQWRVVSIQGLP